jgi:gliding motility-associated-like protein
MKFYFLLFIASFLSFTSLSQCNIQASICESGTMSQSFNFVSTSGAYAGGAFANAGCSTGAGGQHRYGFITLYITESGLLNLLIDGDANSGFIDVAIFRVPSGISPCTAIQSSSNAIGCNFADFAGGCVQFGNAFSCSSSVPAPAVNAGDEIMIVAQSYTSGTSTTFQLQLSDALGSAKTGLPDASIDPSSLGPFCTSNGLMQITAANMGGVWSGAGISPSGLFDPQAVGNGTHTINYSIGVAPCNSSSSAQISVGSINVSNFNVGGCSGGTHGLTGNINISHPPSTGHLMVKNCMGQQQVVASAPFSSGSYPFNLTGLNPNGAPCNIEAYFADNAFSHSLQYQCSHVLQYTAPTCTSACSFTSINGTPTPCQVGNTYTLSGSVSFVNPPASGQLIIEDCSGNSQTFNAPFSSPINYSINSLTPSGASCTVTARFTANTTCTTSTSYTSPSIPIVTASPDITICPGVTVSLFGSGANTYSWNNGAGNNSEAIVSPTSTTTYTVTGYTNGCTATDQVTVTIETNSLSPSIIPDTTICAGNLAKLYASGGVSYSWGELIAGNPGPIIDTGDTLNISPTQTTTYYVYVEDADGCTGANQVTVTTNPTPTVSVADTSLCETETVTIIASGADTYSWSPATYLNTASGSTVIFTPGQSTNYTIVGTSANGCTDTTTLAVTVHPNPPIDAGDDQTECEGAQITLTATGAGINGTYVWDNALITNGVPFTPPVGSNVYTVTGTTSDGCTATDQVTVTIGASSFAPTVSPNVAICAGESTVISASNATSYTWTPGLGTGASHTVSPSSTTTYTVTGTDPNGCIGSNQVTVTVNPIPVVTANNVEVCVNGTVAIQAGGANTYTWSPATYLNTITGQTVNFTPGSSTVYTITGTSTAGCVGTTTVTATAHPNPTIEAGNDVFGCEGDLIILTAEGAGMGGSYTWDHSVANTLPFIPPVGVTVYNVVGTTSNGCTGTDFLTVNFDAIPQVAFTSVQDQNCVPVEATFDNTGDSGAICKWVFDNGTTVETCGSVTQSFTYPGVYGATLQVESPNGCISYLYQDSMVIVHPDPVASFTPSPVIFNTTNTLVKFTNNSSGAVSYFWDFGDDAGIGSTEVSPSFRYPEEPGGYLVELIAISAAGCIDTAYYSIRAQEDLIFYVPNTFTPDNDEFNQVFKPIFTSGFDPFDYTLLIFNRWGEKVFESHDVLMGWSGSYGVVGNPCQDGMYTWKIEFKSINNDERKIYTGHVNLMR